MIHIDWETVFYVIFYTFLALAGCWLLLRGLIDVIIHHASQIDSVAKHARAVAEKHAAKKKLPRRKF